MTENLKNFINFFWKLNKTFLVQWSGVAAATFCSNGPPIRVVQFGSGARRRAPDDGANPARVPGERSGSARFSLVLFHSFMAGHGTVIDRLTRSDGGRCVCCLVAHARVHPYENDRRPRGRGPV